MTSPVKHTPQTGGTEYGALRAVDFIMGADEISLRLINLLITLKLTFVKSKLQAALKEAIHCP
jgi:hypothetical protein